MLLIVRVRVTGLKPTRRFDYENYYLVQLYIIIVDQIIHDYSNMGIRIYMHSMTLYYSQIFGSWKLHITILNSMHVNMYQVISYQVII